MRNTLSARPGFEWRLSILPGHDVRLGFGKLLITHPEKRPLLVDLETGDAEEIAPVLAWSTPIRQNSWVYDRFVRGV